MKHVSGWLAVGMCACEDPSKDDGVSESDSALEEVEECGPGAQVVLDGDRTFDDLQEAMNVAGSGSELLLCPGTYEGPFQALEPVRIVSREDASTTTLSGNSEGGALSVKGGSELVGLTLQEGQTGQRGGGLEMTTSGTLILRDCVVTGNRARQGGGLFVATDSEVTLVNTRVLGNVADETAGGVYVSTGSVLDLTEGSEVVANVAENAAGGVELADATLRGGRVADNTLVSIYGSFTYSYGTYGTQYYLSYSGLFGGAGVSASGTSRVEGAEVTGNVGHIGAGVSVTGGELTLLDVSVHDNASDAEGGGAGVVAAFGTLHLEGSTEVFANTGAAAAGAYVVGGPERPGRLVGGTLRDNVATALGGGAVLFHGQLEGTTVSGNTAPMGGGAYVVLAGGLLDVLLTDNQADQGGGLYTEGESWLEGGAVLRNVAQLEGGGGFVSSEGQLSATGTDFGTDADDNVPSDVFAGEAYTDFGEGSTLTCDAQGCVSGP